jgi:hypothetical protein
MSLICGHVQAAEKALKLFDCMVTSHQQQQLGMPGI